MVSSTLPSRTVKTECLTCLVLVRVVRALFAPKLSSLRLIMALGTVATGSAATSRISGLTRWTVKTHCGTTGYRVRSRMALLTRFMTLRDRKVAWLTLNTRALPGEGLLCASRTQGAYSSADILGKGPSGAVFAPPGGVIGSILTNATIIAQ